MDNFMYGDISVPEAEEVAMTTITQEEYEELLERDQFLTALEQAGVDNWVGYDFAQEIFDAFNQA